MKRLWLAGICVIMVLAGDIAFAAQSAKRLPRIGYLVLSPLTDPPSPERAGFLRGLREHGYEAGNNIIIEYRSADGDREKLTFLAEELVELKVDVIVAPAGPPLLAARDATRTIPIVMMFSADPVTAGLVQSLARPGGNVTGVSMQNVELAEKRLELLKEAIPAITRVAVLWDSSNVMVHREWEATQRTARRLGITLVPVDIRGEADLSPALPAHQEDSSAGPDHDY